MKSFLDEISAPIDFVTVPNSLSVTEVQRVVAKLRKEGHAVSMDETIEHSGRSLRRVFHYLTCTKCVVRE